jgi:hypothetical protein
LGDRDPKIEKFFHQKKKKKRFFSSYLVMMVNQVNPNFAKEYKLEFLLGIEKKNNNDAYLI